MWPIILYKKLIPQVLQKICNKLTGPTLIPTCKNLFWSEIKGPWFVLVCSSVRRNGRCLVFTPPDLVRQTAVLKTNYLRDRGSGNQKSKKNARHHLLLILSPLGQFTLRDLVDNSSTLMALDNNDFCFRTFSPYTTVLDPQVERWDNEPYQGQF